MTTVAILGFDDSYSSVVGGFADLLQVAKAHMAKQGMPSAGLFEWPFISQDGRPVLTSNGLELGMRALPKDLNYDLIFITKLHYRGWQHFHNLLEKQIDVRY